jgi:hypothetical protein
MRGLVKPRILGVDEVPIVFWSWRTQTPSDDEVHKVFTSTGAKILFQRAGQFDLVDGKIKRIRPAIGKFPSIFQTHLVYNATRRLLRDLEELDNDEIAASIAGTFRHDVEMAKTDDVRIVGLQLDFDIATRLLPKYAEFLGDLVGLLPKNTELSITGLPTWVSSSDLGTVLSEVDFWIPQLYGAAVPTKVNQKVPISSAEEVKLWVKQIRELEKPFYAGLAAYGYSILYAKDGTLVELRGDLDPVNALQTSDFEFVDLHDFSNRFARGETRYTYRAKKDIVLDGLIINEGETLVFQTPSVESLRAAARAVRENAGDVLRGICLFRLPTETDRTSMTVEEITAAVFDRPAELQTELTLRMASDGRLALVATNTGSARTMLGDATTIDLEMPSGTISGLVARSGFTSFETHCKTVYRPPSPCSPKRANLIRLKLSWWVPGDSAAALLTTTGELPRTVSAVVSVRVDDGRVERESLLIPVDED